MFSINIEPEDPRHIEALAALLSTVFSEGLQIHDTGITAYAKCVEIDDQSTRDLLAEWEKRFGFQSQIEELPHVNWNEEWERNFDPVVVEDILTIRALFHEIEITTDWTITIQPRMSFGTGHHATTWMMVRAMALLDFRGRKVLDAGTGTGILAILAGMWKASQVYGFDNDEWSYENAIQNLELNPTSEVDSHIDFHNATLSNVADIDFDIILANINRNFLLEEAGALAARLNPGGYLVISGFYDVDSIKLLDRFHALNLVAQYLQIREKWACIVLRGANILNNKRLT